MQDANVSEETRDKFCDLCSRYPQTHTSNFEDFGHTDLLAMDIKRGDSLPILQRPYNYTLKHTTYVQKSRKHWKKQEPLFKVFLLGLVLLWSYQDDPGTPTRRRLCVDYRDLNDLLHPVTKAYSKAEGVLILAPWSKIHEIYAQLTGSRIYSTLDLRSGCYHIAFSAGSHRKSAFVTPVGKFEF